MDALSILSTGAQLLFFLITIVFVLFTIAIAYHWYTFGNSRHTTTIALSVYVIVSAPLFLTMALALHFLPV